MLPEVAEQVFPPDLRARLDSLLDLRPGPVVTDYATPEAVAALNRAEVLITGWGCPPLDERTLDAAPRLRAVIHAAGSVREAEISRAAWQRGITVSSAALANAWPVAQFTVSVILLAHKRAFALASSYRRDGFRAYPTSGDTGNTGRTVGVVGASRIGRMVIDLLRAHAFRVLVADPYLRPSEAAGLGAELVDLDDLLTGSDTVTLHAPLLPATHHLIDDRRLGLLRDGAVLVNTARGAIVDTDALLKHCGTGRIDAVLDVVEPEPLPPGHPLFSLPNVFITPHIAGALGREIRLLGEFAVRETERWLDGAPLAGRVDAEDLARIA
ncbi:hydroxyacid dehydrogenase [Streptomyces mesophilus]|uniref:hydroxyacid dehydrogenase n=1 Tax=Streptomyces mesophilus TaxID=1775132 RepID=UPI003316E5BB